MPDQIIHVIAPISREELEIVVSGLEVACGGSSIKITESWELIVKDPRQVQAIRSLFDTRVIDSYQVKDTGPKVKKAKHIMRAWRILNNLGQVVEQISIEEKNRRLSAGEFDPDTILHHPKAGRQRVTGSKGSPQGMVPS